MNNHFLATRTAIFFNSMIKPDPFEATTDNLSDDYKLKHKIWLEHAKRHKLDNIFDKIPDNFVLDKIPDNFVDNTIKTSIELENAFPKNLQNSNIYEHILDMSLYEKSEYADAITRKYCLNKKFREAKCRGSSGREQFVFDISKADATTVGNLALLTLTRYDRDNDIFSYDIIMEKLIYQEFSFWPRFKRWVWSWMPI